MNLPQYNSYGVKIADVEIPKKLLDNIEFQREIIKGEWHFSHKGVTVLATKDSMRLPVQRCNHAGVFIPEVKKVTHSNYVSPIYTNSIYKGD